MFILVADRRFAWEHHRVAAGVHPPHIFLAFTSLRYKT